MYLPFKIFLFLLYTISHGFSIGYENISATEGDKPCPKQPTCPIFPRGRPVLRDRNIHFRGDTAIYTSPLLDSPENSQGLFRKITETSCKSRGKVV
jgi:hypothetical protein